MGCKNFNFGVTERSYEDWLPRDENFVLNFSFQWYILHDHKIKNWCKKLVQISMNLVTKYEIMIQVIYTGFLHRFLILRSCKVYHGKEKIKTKFSSLGSQLSYERSVTPKLRFFTLHTNFHELLWVFTSSWPIFLNTETPWTWESKMRSNPVRWESKII